MVPCKRFVSSADGHYAVYDSTADAMRVSFPMDLSAPMGHATMSHLEMVALVRFAPRHWHGPVTRGRGGLYFQVEYVGDSRVHMCQLILPPYDPALHGVQCLDYPHVSHFYFGDRYAFPLLRDV